MKFKIQLLLHYFWDSPGLGFRVISRKWRYAKVIKISEKTAWFLNKYIGIK